MSEQMTPLSSQPPDGSVALDVGGYAWQRDGDGWLIVGSGLHISWDALWRGYGPIRIIWRATEEGEDA